MSETGEPLRRPMSDRKRVLEPAPFGLRTFDRCVRRATVPDTVLGRFMRSGPQTKMFVVAAVGIAATGMMSINTLVTYLRGSNPSRPSR